MEKSAREAVKLQEKVAILVQKLRREADLEVYEADLKKWEDKTAGWKKGVNGSTKLVERSR